MKNNNLKTFNHKNIDFVGEGGQTEFSRNFENSSQPEVHEFNQGENYELVWDREGQEIDFADLDPLRFDSIARIVIRENDESSYDLFVAAGVFYNTKTGSLISIRDLDDRENRTAKYELSNIIIGQPWSLVAGGKVNNSKIVDSVHYLDEKNSSYRDINIEKTSPALEALDLMGRAMLDKLALVHNDRDPLMPSKDLVGENAENDINAREERISKFVDSYFSQELIEEISNVESRLDFIREMSPDNFVNFLAEINAAGRGLNSIDVKEMIGHISGTLPVEFTPPTEIAADVLKNGFIECQKYINDPEFSNEDKIRSLSFVMENLIKRVHLFPDGNGRTARFVGSMIEHGLSDKQKVIEEASSGANRNFYDSWARFNTASIEQKEYEIRRLQNDDIIDERSPEEIREEIDSGKYKSQTETIKVDIANMLRDKDFIDDRYRGREEREALTENILRERES